LFRETKGAEICKDQEMSLQTITLVKDALDLEKEETAYRYVKRYGTQTMKPEVIAAESS